VHFAAQRLYCAVGVIDHAAAGRDAQATRIALQQLDRRGECRPLGRFTMSADDERQQLQAVNQLQR
jgi:hypothetical protein